MVHISSRPQERKGGKIPGGGKKKVPGKYVMKYSECDWKSSEVFGNGRLFFKISSRNPRKKSYAHSQLHKRESTAASFLY